MYTVKSASKQLGISLSLCYALVSAKKIRHERHGLRRGTIRISAEALEEYRQGRTVDVGEPEKPKVRKYQPQNF